MRLLWTCAHPYCSVHALSQGYLGLADVPGSPGQKWLTSLHRIIRLLTKGHNWYGRSRTSTRSGCMKLNTQGSVARGELAIIFLLIHSPFRPLNIFVTVLDFPTRHVRNTCESISRWCTPDGFKTSLDVVKFLLWLLFWGKKFITGPFLSLLTSRWRSSHSIPGFSPHTCQKMVQMVPHSPSEKVLTKRTVVPSLPSFPLPPSPSPSLYPSLLFTFLPPFPPLLFLSHQCYWVPLCTRPWNGKDNDGGILLPVSSNSRVHCVSKWTRDSFKTLWWSDRWSWTIELGLCGEVVCTLS